MVSQKSTCQQTQDDRYSHQDRSRLEKQSSTVNPHKISEAVEEKKDQK